MKILLKILYLLLMSLTCLSQSCPTYTNQLHIGTGWDYNTNSTYSTSDPGTPDPNWIIVSDGDPTSTEPRPATAVVKVGAWGGPVANSEWVGVYPRVYIYPPGYYDYSSISSYGQFVIEYKFCLASVAGVSLSFSGYSDDQADIFINNNPVGTSPNFVSYGILSSFGPITSSFVVGTNTIKIVLSDVGGAPTGFDFSGTLSSSSNSILLPGCCSNLGFICGQKFNDINGNGVKDLSLPETGLTNWTISVNDGTNIISQPTGYNGNYFFSNLTPGNYTVTEQNQLGYNVIVPSSGNYQLTLGPGQVYNNIDFLNHPCGCNLSNFFLDGQSTSFGSTPINICKNQAFNLSMNTNTCTIAAGGGLTYNWDFGDGTSVNGIGVSHAYSSTGNYTVSMVPQTTTGCGPQTNTFIVNVVDCQGNLCDKCISSFAPGPGDYIISAWVKEDRSTPVLTYSTAGVQVSFINDPSSFGPFFPNSAKNKIIEGWQRIEEKFTVPPGATDLKINLVNTSNTTPSPVDVYFDDIRVHPVNGNMKTYVYDPITLRLVAELDENNYATLYEYNEEGQLIRVKKETEKGIMTIKETRSSNKKQ